MPGSKIVVGSSVATPSPSSTMLIKRLRRDARNRDVDARSSVVACVFEQRLQDSIDELTFDRDVDGRRRQARSDLDACGGGEGSCGLRRAHDGIPGIACRVEETRFLSRGSDESVDGRRHLGGIPEHRFERLAILDGFALPAERELRLAADAGERRPQLVRELGGQTLLVAQARREAVEQRVERRPELRQLIVRQAEPEAPVEVAFAPRRGRGGHLGDGRECRSKDPMRSEADCAEHGERENDRSDQRGLLRLAVCLGGDRGDDGSESLPWATDRYRVQAGVETGDVGRAAAASGESQRLALQRACASRRLQHVAPPVEHPDLAAHEFRVGGGIRRDLPVADLNRLDLGFRLCPSGRSRARGEAAGQDVVEAADERDDRERNDADDGEQESRADPDPACQRIE